MAKSSPRKSLKSWFSRSEANLSAPPAEKDADKSAGEKKKFKFLKFKTKSKGSSAPEKPAKEIQQVARYAPESFPLGVCVHACACVVWLRMEQQQTQDGEL